MNCAGCGTGLVRREQDNGLCWRCDGEDGNFRCTDPEAEWIAEMKADAELSRRKEESA